jgi:hypothetical protein
MKKELEILKYFTKNWNIESQKPLTIFGVFSEDIVEKIFIKHIKNPITLNHLKQLYEIEASFKLAFDISPLNIVIKIKILNFNIIKNKNIISKHVADNIYIYDLLSIEIKNESIEKIIIEHCTEKFKPNLLVMKLFA